MKKYLVKIAYEHEIEIDAPDESTAEEWALVKDETDYHFGGDWDVYVIKEFE